MVVEVVAATTSHPPSPHSHRQLAVVTQMALQGLVAAAVVVVVGQAVFKLQCGA